MIFSTSYFDWCASSFPNILYLFNFLLLINLAPTQYKSNECSCTSRPNWSQVLWMFPPIPFPHCELEAYNADICSRSRGCQHSSADKPFPPPCVIRKTEYGRKKLKSKEAQGQNEGVGMARKKKTKDIREGCRYERKERRSDEKWKDRRNKFKKWEKGMRGHMREAEQLITVSLQQLNPTHNPLWALWTAVGLFSVFIQLNHHKKCWHLC